MSDQSEVTQVGLLVLARVLVGGEQGATASEIKKDLGPLLQHRWSGSALTDQLEQTFGCLVSAGLIARFRKGRTDRSTLSVAGQRSILEVLGLDALPAKTTWSVLKKTYLTAVALGLPTPDVDAAKRLGTADGFKAALLAEKFGPLLINEYPTIGKAIDAFAWKLLGIETDQTFSVKAVQAALIGRELGQGSKVDPKPDPKKEATKLLAKAVGARKSGNDELLLAAIRQWIDGVSAEPELHHVAHHAEPGPARDVAPLDLNSFATRVVEAARSSPTGRFGDNKVFVVHVWNMVKQDPEFSSMDLDGFKQRLAEANNARLLDLSRADLVAAMDPNDVRLSEISYFGGTFHFVRI
ncbi:MAG: hypothetical protein ABI353_06755 [Isosphaeraceae bacterium]